MTTKKEKIVCGAFRFIFSACEEIVLTLDYKMNYHAQDLYGRDYLTGFDKGFITNRGRFVDAKEALEMSGLKSQMKFQDRDYLLPEDLY